MSGQTPIKYSVVDLFAGAGGLSLGFLQTGRFTIRAAFENNPHAQRTYGANHKGCKVYDDVALVLTDEVKKELGHVSVVIGGPPCQGFSNANRQKNHTISQNNSLAKKFVQAILFLQPEAFVMENVSALQSDVHLFYVSADDRDNIDKYQIQTSDADIVLLASEYMFDEAAAIVQEPADIGAYIWEEADYLALNVIYKNRNNAEKLKKALKKHKKRLFALAESILQTDYENGSIAQRYHQTAMALQNYYQLPVACADNIGSTIEPAIMIQRMLNKAIELLDNNIVVEEYNTENGLVAKVKSMAVIDYIYGILGSEDNGYSINRGVLSAAEFGAPQKRMRFVIMGVKKAIAQKVELPKGFVCEKEFRTVFDAIGDLEPITAWRKMEDDAAGIVLPKALGDISALGKVLRDADVLKNHIATATTPEALKRFRSLKAGENFHNLPDTLKTTYSDAKRTQNTIYLRLDGNQPSGTVVNVRKSMWIHPVLDRALSIREAARLQTFPDSFVFYGPKDAQYQQVGNAVPPMLAKAIAEHLLLLLGGGE